MSGPKDRIPRKARRGSTGKTLRSGFGPLTTTRASGSALTESHSDSHPARGGCESQESLGQPARQARHIRRTGPPRRAPVARLAPLGGSRDYLERGGKPAELRLTTRKSGVTIALSYLPSGHRRLTAAGLTQIASRRFDRPGSSDCPFTRRPPMTRGVGEAAVRESRLRQHRRPSCERTVHRRRPKHQPSVNAHRGHKTPRIARGPRKGRRFCRWCATGRHRWTADSSASNHPARDSPANRPGREAGASAGQGRGPSPAATRGFP